ncbi:hypothetical protein MICRO80W_140058 [Micrococcus luteus]|nr:hypothetical protein MICRO80W_140058 [Micrococcus luteus]
MRGGGAGRRAPRGSLALAPAPRRTPGRVAAGSGARGRRSPRRGRRGPPGDGHAGPRAARGPRRGGPAGGGGRPRRDRPHRRVLRGHARGDRGGCADGHPPAQRVPARPPPRARARRRPAGGPPRGDRDHRGRRPPASGHGAAGRPGGRGAVDPRLGRDGRRRLRRRRVPPRAAAGPGPRRRRAGGRRGWRSRGHRRVHGHGRRLGALRRRRRGRPRRRAAGGDGRARGRPGASRRRPAPSREPSGRRRLRPGARGARGAPSRNVGEGGRPPRRLTRVGSGPGSDPDRPVVSRCDALSHIARQAGGRWRTGRTAVDTETTPKDPAARVPTSDSATPARSVIDAATVPDARRIRTTTVRRPRDGHAATNAVR